MPVSSSNYSLDNYNPKSPEFAVFLGFIFITLQVLNFIFVQEQNSRVMISNLMQTITALFASYFILLAANQTKKKKPENYKGWLFISISSMLWAGGSLIFLLIEVVFRKPPYPSVPDFFFIAFYPMMIIGFLKLPANIIEKSDKPYYYYDMLAVTFAFSVIIWKYSLSASYDSMNLTPTFALIFSFVYSILDIALLYVIHSVLIRRKLYKMAFKPIVVLIVGCFFLIFSDLMQSYIETFTNFTSGTSADIGWCIFAAFAGVAGALQLKEVSPSEEINF